MKLGIVRQNDKRCVALCAEGTWLNFTAAHQAYRSIEEGVSGEPVESIEELLDAGLVTSLFLSKVVQTLKDCDQLKPFVFAEAPAQFELPLRPRVLICLGRNYAAHAKESGHEPPQEPIFFAKSPAACIGDGQAIVVEEWYGRVDPEAELAVVMGRALKRQRGGVTAEEARSAIAGYTIVNDVTARDMQQRDIDQGLPWFRSKSLATFCPLGPVIALPDELPWPVEVDIELKVNGQTRQEGNTARFLFTIPEVLAHLTRLMDIEPGHVVSTGTPEGIAPIRPGDVVEIHIPPIGTLRNPVALYGDSRR